MVIFSCCSTCSLLIALFLRSTQESIHLSIFPELTVLGETIWFLPTQHTIFKGTSHSQVLCAASLSKTRIISWITSLRTLRWHYQYHRCVSSLCPKTLWQCLAPRGLSRWSTAGLVSCLRSSRQWPPQHFLAPAASQWINPGKREEAVLWKYQLVWSCTACECWLIFCYICPAVRKCGLLFLQLCGSDDAKHIQQLLIVEVMPSTYLQL